MYVFAGVCLYRTFVCSRLTLIRDEYVAQYVNMINAVTLNCSQSHESIFSLKPEQRLRV